MKKLLLILFLLTLTISFAQEKSKMVKDEKSRKNMFVGIGDKSVFKDTSFSTWYNAEYDVYELDKKELDSITPEKLKDVKISIVLGTWCGDTKREIPRFIKILEAVKFDEKNLTMIFVNREKKNPLGDVEALNAKNIPTIIIYRGSKELGRIIEAPKNETLEKDLAEILK
jgi:thiol-disulfide isomerase/thioredoxin